jgi:hypothetical protein
LMRRGAAWVGVSAQKIGVEGGGSLIGLASYGLKETNPARYGALHHPGDRFSYDIYGPRGRSSPGWVWRGCWPSASPSRPSGSPPM